MTTTADTPTKKMDSWSMSCSLLVGMRQAITVATAEHEALLAANAGNPRPAGASTVADLIASLREVSSSLSCEMNRIARSNNLPMPEHKQP